MFARLRKGGAVAAALTLALAGLGFGTPALAIDEPTYRPDEAKLTKVIDAPADTNASEDAYVFHFAGGGEVTEGNADGSDKDNLYSDGVIQDATTIKIGDTVPTIADVTLNGANLTADNTLTNGQVVQGVVQKTIAEILDEQSVEFPHAGVYTYVVTEKAVNLVTAAQSDGVYVNASQAEYTLRIRVVNTKTTINSDLNNRELTIEDLTVEQTKDDNGDAITAEKIDPTYPTTTNTNKIDKTAEDGTPGTNELAGDSRGRDVPGFTFANEYIKGGSFTVKKLYDGDHSDRTKFSTVRLAVYSEAAKNPDAQGACLTYVVDGEGEDLTNNTDEYGEHKKLNGVEGISQTNDYMAVFNADGWAYVDANLKEDSIIRVTGEFGPYNDTYVAEAPNGKDKRMTLSTSGLLVGQQFYVIEAAPGDYEPTGYVYVGDNTDADPRQDAAGMTATQKLASDTTDPTGGSTTLPEGALLVNDDATGSATTVFVVNKIDENKVSPTGIFIDNLPYILMVGIPVGVFAVLFVRKHRMNAAA